MILLDSLLARSQFQKYLLLHSPALLSTLDIREIFDASLFFLETFRTHAIIRSSTCAIRAIEKSGTSAMR
jgi:hypothetical protein